MPHDLMAVPDRQQSHDAAAITKNWWFRHFLCTPVRSR